MGMTADVYAVSPDQLANVSSDTNAFAELTRYDNESATTVSLEKAWHGLHFLLNGDAWDSDGPLAFIIAGGTAIPDSDGGYGPARSFSPAQASAIHNELSAVAPDDLWARFNPTTMTEQGIYPEIWDEPAEDLREEYLFYFNDLKKLVADAVGNGHGIIVFLA